MIQTKNLQKINISMSEIKTWNKGDIILINAPTGAGKTTFIKNNLRGHCRADSQNKKILMLSNRDILKQQNLVDFNNDRHLRFKNYQSIEKQIKENWPIKYYDYIVADEAHYFFSDSDFNRSTDLTLDWLNNHTDSVVILLTATSTLVKKYYQEVLGRTIKEYQYQPDYNYIDEFYFYQSDKAVETLLSKLPSNEKAMYFTNIQKACSITDHFPNARFICSKTSKNPLAYKSDLKVKQEIINNKKFSCQILCTTNVLDNGVNIIDSAVKHIIIDYFDLDTIQQCFGRKRIQADEKVNLYIMEFEPKAVNGYLTDAKNKLTPAYYLLENGEEAFATKYYKKNFNNKMIDYIYKNNKTIPTVNKIMLFKTQEMVKCCEQILDKESEISFKSLVCERFNRDIGNIKNLESKYDDYNLTNYLEKLVGLKLFEKEQEALKKYVIEDLFKPAKTNHGRIGYNTINNFFQDLELPFEIRSYKENSRKSEYWKKTYWMVYKLTPKLPLSYNIG